MYVYYACKVFKVNEPTESLVISSQKQIGESYSGQKSIISDIQ